ncbi:hypothetical protein K2F40_16760 [Clostridium sp. CM028]|uniref:hypothetical protein n=1 Tax=Clostridium sp. CM028 TaxID=2851575 RepID=UPI001C6EEDB5|nr:hypothetical protein [Clostridium sp. CM028]MBW9150582.1 hypothetical protein [Clostridium sp. CM028]WLC62780.1 hypothetical protein KTC94_05845 [Clostridium sp. CM028]
MKNKHYMKGISKVFAITSISISLTMIMLMLNGLFQIIPCQNSGGLIVFMTPIISIIGGVLASISLKIHSNILAKLGIITNIVSLILVMLIMGSLGTTASLLFC